MMYRFLKSQQGQTVVEYVLVLTIVLIVVLGTVYQLNQNFQNFSRNYFGSYVRCLLESGELPNLGSEQDRNSYCDNEYQPFSIAFGRPPVDSTAFDSDTNNASGSNSRGGSSDNKGDSASGEGASESSDNGGRAASFSQAGRLGGNASLRPSRITIDPNKDKAENADTANVDAISSRTVRRRSYNRSSKQSSINRIEGRPSYFAASKIDQEQVEAQGIRGQVEGEEGSQSLRKKKIQQDIPKRKTANVQAEEEMSFGSFIRYLIISAIIIALVLFLLGQFVQIQKSMEKG